MLTYILMTLPQLNTLRRFKLFSQKSCLNVEMYFTKQIGGVIFYHSINQEILPWLIGKYLGNSKVLIRSQILADNSYKNIIIFTWVWGVPVLLLSNIQENMLNGGIQQNTCQILCKTILFTKTNGTVWLHSKCTCTLQTCQGSSLR